MTFLKSLRVGYGRKLPGRRFCRWRLRRLGLASQKPTEQVACTTEMGLLGSGGWRSKVKMQHSGVLGRALPCFTGGCLLTVSSRRERGKAGSPGPRLRGARTPSGGPTSSSHPALTVSQRPVSRACAGVRISRHGSGQHTSTEATTEALAGTRRGEGLGPKDAYSGRHQLCAPTVCISLFFWVHGEAVLPAPLAVEPTV